jgi:hypothetical protein
VFQCALVVVVMRNWIGVINAKIREKEFDPDRLTSGILLCLLRGLGWQCKFHAALDEIYACRSTKSSHIGVGYDNKILNMAIICCAKKLMSALCPCLPPVSVLVAFNLTELTTSCHFAPLFFLVLLSFVFPSVSHQSSSSYINRRRSAVAFQ